MKGLTQKEVEQKRKHYGFNEIVEKTESNFKKILKKFWGPIPWMIEIAAILSFILQDWVDFYIIFVLLIVNVGIDYLQDFRATNAVAKLKEGLALQALVFRNATFVQLPARELVPGDIIKLKIGDIVPADAKLISGDYLEVDQSSLTGESLPVYKKIDDVVFSGAIIKQGDMIAEVTAIGMKTFMGNSAHLVAIVDEKHSTHFQKAIINIGHFLIAISVILAGIILVVSINRHDVIIEDIRFVMVLLIASIPVALPAVLSVTMAVGALDIAKKKVIIKSLSAIEEMAGFDVLCSDKTGTLTQNKLTIHDPIIYSDNTEEKLFLYAILASTEENQDPIEMPIYEYAKRNHLAGNVDKFKLLSFIPFDPIKKKTKATYMYEDTQITVFKGAPQVIADLSSDKDIKNRVLIDVESLASKGYRSLAVAVKTSQVEPVKIIGIIPFLDPPRKDSVEAIEKIRQMGINIKMLTGDNQDIAKEIAKMLKIGINILPISKMRTGNRVEEQTILAKIIIEGIYKKLNKNITKEQLTSFGQDIANKITQELGKTKMSDSYIKQHESDIIKLIEKADGFSQVLPEDKYFIIDKLQKNKHFVAMTGDGVNDAPALKKADVGIAVLGATDAARAASDIVLMAPGLSVIEEAIKMARETFERMKGYATFRIAETIRIVLFMSLSIVVFNFYPVTAVMIIMLALLNDIPVMMIAYDNSPLDEKPVYWNMREVLTVSSVLGIAGVLSSFLIFYYLQIHSYPIALIQAMLFLKLDVAGHSTLYLTRTGKKHFWKKPFPSLKFFLPAFATRILGTLIAVYGIFMEPIGWKIAGLIWIYALIWWVFNDYVKVGTYKIMDYIRRQKNEIILK